MKYLKTYEIFKIRKDDKPLVVQIKEWMNHNSFTELNLGEFNIYRDILYFNDKIVGLNLDDNLKDLYDDYLLVVAIDSDDDRPYNFILSDDSDATTILKVLNSLTPDEIEQIRAEQESEKFNF